jgi:hypothetical protein
MTRVSQSLVANPKRPRVSWRRNVVLRRSLLVLLLTFTFLFICGVTGAAGRIADTMVLYVHLAGLYTKTPDKSLSMPIKDVTKSQIANTWHAPRGDDRLHEGQDIFAPKGTPVLSATTGYVVKIGEDNLGGHTVSVVGDGGRKYYYAHLDAYASHLEVGDYVTRNTVLGYVGTTGNADGTPPHLHFGIYASDGAIDPLPLLTDRPQEKKKVDPKTDKTRARKKS